MTPIIVTAIAITAFICLLIIFRSLWAWLFRINDVISKQTDMINCQIEIINQLKRLNGD